ncbi:UNVERIFIED_CONTAM: hypothetical protein HDU68_005495, partial [Siphonaria sp. JEL0065]
WRKPLALSDVYQSPKALSAQTLSNIFFDEWDKVLAAHLSTGDRKNPGGKLLRLTIWNIFFKRVFLIGFLMLISNLCNLVAPYFVKYLLEFADNQHAANLHIPGFSLGSKGQGVGLVFGLLASQVVGSFLSNHFTQESSVEAIKARTMMTAVIYRKSLKLSSAARQEFPSGSVINLVSTDTARVEQFFIFANYLWVLPLVIIINIALLLFYLGVPVLAGIFVLVVSVPMQGYFYGLIMKIRAVLAPIASKRVNLTTEVLSGIRVIKFFAWETSFYEKVTAIREAEITLVLRRAIIGAYTMTQAFSTPILSSCSTFVIYGAMHPLDPATIFSGLAWFNQLR